MSTMKVWELVAALRHLPQDAPVFVHVDWQGGIEYVPLGEARELNLKADDNTPGVAYWEARDGAPSVAIFGRADFAEGLDDDL